jgi:hypothetical protein
MGNRSGKSDSQSGKSAMKRSSHNVDSSRQVNPYREGMSNGIIESRLKPMIRLSGDEEEGEQNERKQFDQLKQFRDEQV